VFGRCGELGHNSRTCLGLRDRARRGERARRWQQEQNDCQLDVTMEGLNDEVEAQVQRETGGDNDSNVDNVVIDSDSELSQLRSCDFEGMEL
jgi:hypothetical protein